MSVMGRRPILTGARAEHSSGCLSLDSIVNATTIPSDRLDAVTDNESQGGAKLAQVKSKLCVVTPGTCGQLSGSSRCVEGPGHHALV